METAAATASDSRTGAPLGPESLTWRYFGDTRGVLMAQRAAVLQVMHPAIAAALKDHSDVFQNPIGRLIRSAGPILGVVYDEEPLGTGRWVRDQHPPIRGRDASGRAYHALDPDTYYWAHATFFEAQIATQEAFGRPLARTQKERLYAESITWYARYGMTMRPVPKDYSAFENYWEAMFDEVLEPTSLARASVRPTNDITAPSTRLAGLPWRILGPIAGRAGPWLVRMTLPPRALELLEVRPTRADELGFQALRLGVKGAWPLVPSRLRMLPRARARARGR